LRTVRVWIKKEGRAKYISHLDMNRCFTRAVRRAGLPVWYTEGFNPHPYLNFLTPLPLGQESAAEPLDMKLDGEMDNAEVAARLQALLPEGIEVTAVTDPVRDALEIAAAEYEARLVFGGEDMAAGFAQKSGELIKGGLLTAEKTGKQGRHKVQKQINVCEHILRWEINVLGAVCVMKVTLPCGNKSNLNPALLLSVLRRETGLGEELCSVRRVQLLCGDFSEFA